MLLENTSMKKNSFSIENLAKSSVENAKEIKRPEHISEDHGYNHYPPHLLPRVPALVPIYPSEALSSRNVPESIGIQGRKRHNSTGSSTDAESLSDSKELSFGKSSSSELDIDNRTPSPIGSDYTDDDDIGSKRKKARTAFTSDQIFQLEKRFQAQKYLAANERGVVADKLKLSDQQVKTWFQNRRMKEKRQQKDTEQSHIYSFPTGGVDIAQLPALGIPFPPPVGVAQFSGYPIGYPSGYSMSPMRPMLSMPDIRSPYSRPVPLTHPMTSHSAVPLMNGHFANNAYDSLRLRQASYPIL